MQYKRILLKLSGEALMGDGEYGIDSKVLSSYATEIHAIVQEGIELAIVIGGGNIYRGIQSEGAGFDRIQGDHMGMLATIINGMALQSALESIDIETRLLTAIRMEQVAEPYIRRKAIRHLEKNRIVIFAAGTGNPFFSTDTAASLRASELNCSLIVKATKVNGIYEQDPIDNPKAKLLKNVSYSEVLNKNLKVMDSTAISLAKESKIPILVTSIFQSDSLINTLKGIGEYSTIN